MKFLKAYSSASPINFESSVNMIVEFEDLLKRRFKNETIFNQLHKQICTHIGERIMDNVFLVIQEQYPELLSAARAKNEGPL